MSFIAGVNAPPTGQQSAGSPARPQYRTGLGPQIPAFAPPLRLDDRSQRLVQWQQSNEARRFGGRWVLLDADTLSVVDSDISASELLSRRPADGSAVIVFVQPAGRVVV